MIVLKCDRSLFGAKPWKPHLLGYFAFDLRAPDSEIRNRKSPQFSVTNIPVASQTAVGMFFFIEKTLKIRRTRSIASIFHRKVNCN